MTGDTPEPRARVIRALSVRQPWAELIASGAKSVEVRSWCTKHRGRMLVCAGVGWHKLGRSMHGAIGLRGVDVCTVELVDCVPLTEALRDLAMLPPDFALAGQWAWLLRDPVRVPATPRKGKLSFFEVPWAS